MITASQINGETRRICIRPIALPVEHGGWGLLFEPIVLGLLLAPSPAGLFISLGATGAFLARLRNSISQLLITCQARS